MRGRSLVALDSIDVVLSRSDVGSCNSAAVSKCGKVQVWPGDSWLRSSLSS